MFGRTEQAKLKNRKGGAMPKTGAGPRATRHRHKTRTVSVGMPALETRSRQILAEIIEEAVADPAGLKLPDPDVAFATPEAVAAALAEDQQAAQSVDEFATRDLVTIVRSGASLEVDGSRYSSDELELIAENVAEQASLKINNSGSFSAKELAAIAQTGPGQVIFA